jgi:O-antigen/teichoic acid export membrane protein
MHRRESRLLQRLGLRESTLVLMASLSANGLNYLFNFCMNRLLSPQEYGELSSLLALFMILAIPSTSAGTVTVRYVSQFLTQGVLGYAGAFFVKMLKYLGGYGLILLGGLSLLANVAARFLQLSSPLSVAVLATALLPAVVLPVAQGGLQGLQRFGSLSGNMVLATSSRLLAGLFLVWLGWGVNGALAASTFSGLVAFLCAIGMLRSMWWRRKLERAGSDREVWQYASTAFWGTLAFTLLTNADIILVKHFFPPEEAGFYSAASTLGRVVLYLPVAISTVMFPKAVESHTRREDSSVLARGSLLAAVFLCFPLVAFYFLFPVPLVRLLFGVRYVPSASLIGPLGLGMAFFAVTGVLLQYYLSIRERRFVIAVVAGALSLAVGLYVFHGSIEQVLIVLNVVGLSTLLVGEGWCQGLWG